MNSKACALLTALTLVSGTGAAAAQEAAAWDEDGDDVLSENEFSAGIEESGAFDDWDGNRDDAIGEEEFAGGVFDAWDADESGDLSEDEFAVGTEGWLVDGNEIGNEYAIWGGEDGSLTEDEFASRFSATALFDEWDRNISGRIEEEEFSAGAYRTADADDSGAIEGKELEDDGWFDWL